MKTIIAGSRSITNIEDVYNAVHNSNFDITEVVSGIARGVDRLGEQWAKENNISIKRFPAQWNKYGRSAGYIRNAQMANYSDALIAVWDGKSKGTQHMSNFAKKSGLLVYVYTIKGDE